MVSAHAVPIPSSLGARNSSRAKLKQGTWSDENLQHALDAITDEGMRLRQASKVFGIPTSSLRDHLYNRTTTRHRGIKPTLRAHEEKN